MAEEKKQDQEWDIPIQVVENADVSASSESFTPSTEMPTITSLLNRKKLSGAKQEMPSSEEKKETPSASVNAPHPVAEASAIVEEIPQSISEPIVTPSRRKLPSEPATSTSMTTVAARRLPTAQSKSSGEPPQFKLQLVLEKLTLKLFEKALKKNKKSPDLKKLDCLGFFSSWFSEMAYFEVKSQELIEGVLGYGTLELVTAIRSQRLSSVVLPSVMEIVAQGDTFIGAADALRAEDQKGLQFLGFRNMASIAVVPMVKKGNVIGIWICTSGSAVEITPKEIKAIKKIFSGIEF